MRKLFGLLMVAAFVAALVSPAWTASKTVTGEVVHQGCYVKRGAEKGSGPAHADCALACAKKGLPLAIVAGDGLYVITGDYTKDNNAKLLDFVAKKVEATGEVTEKDGQKSIAVTAIKLAN
jgi:hypothetical protein